MKIAKASRQATRTCRVRGEGSGDDCFTTRFISRACGITKVTLGGRESAKSLSMRH
jgi:hypothetical protein